MNAINKPAHIESLVDEISLDTTKTQAETIDTLPKKDSLWINVWYGLGMLAFIVVPTLIPGLTVRTIIIGYVVLVISIYISAGLITMARMQKNTNKRKRGRKR